MKEEKRNITAIGMISGGLDSVLAARLILDQGIEVIGLHIITPFSSSAVSDGGKENICQKQAVEQGFEYHPLYLGEEYVNLVKNPNWGYGSCMNPCIDCHIFFLKKARELMAEAGAAFVFTGEVLEQRPMSQKRPTLRMVEKRSGLDGYLLRPLSALRLEPAIPEKLGLVDRNRLLGIAGRGRKQQMALAGKLGITIYETPAGGCLLTDPAFSARLKDLFDHGDSDIDSIQMLKKGRHFRLGPHAKLVVGRNESDNRILAHLAVDTDILLEAEGGGSPLSILRGAPTDDEIRLAAAITRRYSSSRKNPRAAVRVRKGSAAKFEKIVPEWVDLEDFENLRIG